MTRTARTQRKTLETDVTVAIDLDGSGVASVATGVGMFDHLLTSFAHHGLFDLEVAAVGDLHVDDHHTVEDTTLVLGTVIADALGDRTGIHRFGDAAVPMDEALARVAIDVGGRPYLVASLPFGGDSIGALSTQNVAHALEALARAGGFTINVEASGSNDHHIAEAVFKALARAMRRAVELDPRRLGPASTKGAT
jgi:imidazoleglycerol-phosphate dehydratase